MKLLSNKSKTKLYDAVHRGWVWSCIGITAVGSAYISYELFLYFTKIRPIKKELEQRFKEELLQEGRMNKGLPQVPQTPSV